MNVMQQRIERRLVIMASLAPDEPMPGAKARMALFDSLPREVRHAIANSDRCLPSMIRRAAVMVSEGKSIKSIIKMIQTKSDAAAGEAARDIAKLELEELGL